MIKKALPPCGGDTSSCPGPYPTAGYTQCHIGCWLDRELFTLPSYVAVIPVKRLRYRHVNLRKCSSGWLIIHSCILSHGLETAFKWLQPSQWFFAIAKVGLLCIDGVVIAAQCTATF